jgi:hypothetical protein
MELVQKKILKGGKGQQEWLAEERLDMAVLGEKGALPGPCLDCTHVTQCHHTHSVIQFSCVSRIWLLPLSTNH